MVRAGESAREDRLFDDPYAQAFVDAAPGAFPEERAVRERPAAYGPLASLGAAFYAHAAAHLPSYARPAFVRVVSEMDVTGTLKQRKLMLAEDGWDPARVGDPLFVRDDDARTYVRLTRAVVAEVRRGRRRF